MYRTFLGSVLSIFTVVVVITYGGFKTSQLVGMLDYKVQTRELLEYYDDDEIFGAKDGFAIAAGIFSNRAQVGSDAVLDPSIGQL